MTLVLLAHPFSSSSVAEFRAFPAKKCKMMGWERAGMGRRREIRSWPKPFFEETEREGGRGIRKGGDKERR